MQILFHTRGLMIMIFSYKMMSEKNINHEPTQTKKKNSEQKFVIFVWFVVKFLLLAPQLFVPHQTHPFGFGGNFIADIGLA